MKIRKTAPTCVTLDSQDFAETMDNRDSADTRTF